MARLPTIARPTSMQLRTFVLLLPVALAACGSATTAVRVKEPPTLQPTAPTAPEFNGEDHTGAVVSLKAALAEGPVVLLFYRGHW